MRHKPREPLRQPRLRYAIVYFFIIDADAAVTLLLRHTGSNTRIKDLPIFSYAVMSALPMPLCHVTLIISRCC